MTSDLHVRGARTHNLKSINITLPRHSLVVITGLSGSGKSSLAFDTLYAEGQRRYVESLSSYARQFLERIPKPDVDSIEGLSPAISIEQKTLSSNPRSTVGTVTEVYDYLRLLFARIGVVHSPLTGKPFNPQTVKEMLISLTHLCQGKPYLLLAPLDPLTTHLADLETLGRRGFQRLWLNGRLENLFDSLPISKNVTSLAIVVDRIAADLDETSIADSFETALSLGQGVVGIKLENDESIHLLTSLNRCPLSGFQIDSIEPRLFSFNSPAGACPQCKGLGKEVAFVPERLIPNPKLSLAQGAIAPWTRWGFYYNQILQALAKVYSFSLDVPYEDLPDAIQKILLYGSGSQSIPMEIHDASKTFRSNKPFEGLIPLLEKRWHQQEESLSTYQEIQPCSLCRGDRLKAEALCIKIREISIAQLSMWTVEILAQWIAELPSYLSSKEKTIAAPILQEIRHRLSFLGAVGLDYLSFSRGSDTLSGGESQRIRLASQIGSGLQGVLYVLDEPSIGLHARDHAKLIDALKTLRDVGNSLIVVEHDEETMRAADFLVDMGPGSGVFGGEVVVAGTPDEVLKHPTSLTAAYLRKERFIPIPPQRRSGNSWLTLHNASCHNLANITVSFPLGTLIAVTGVSGSGKSSLIMESLRQALLKPESTPLRLEGCDKIHATVDIDQSPIGRTSRSNPATYSGIFDHIRLFFAQLPLAKSRGYGPGRFSFNVEKGRCSACNGDGVIRVEMHFLPDIEVTCDRCQGLRYSHETLEVTYKNMSIADVLNLTVDEALDVFKSLPPVRDRLSMLVQVGLGYLKLGQRATTLSGGEAQRLKLSKELAKRYAGSIFYILDEPTTGLHFEDIRHLLFILQRLVAQGHTVLVIEHHMDIIKTADWVIDMGPEAGSRGGRVVAEGTPEHIVTCPESLTGAYLKPYLDTALFLEKKDVALCVMPT